MARKKKRRLKLWVKITLWCIAFTLGTWILWWPMNTLHLYWERQSLANSKDHTPAWQSTTTPLSCDSAKIHALNKFLDSPSRLNKKDIAVCIWDLNTNTPVILWQDRELMVPASSLKLLTAISAMKRLGTNHRFTERIMVTGQVQNGTLQGNAIFQADDNPMVESLGCYIQALKNHGIRRIQGNFIINLMRTDTLKAHHTASRWDIPYNRTPILLKGAPRIAQEINALLQQNGISSPYPAIEKGLKIYPGARTLKRTSTNIGEIIAPMLIHSSNIKADALAYHTSHYKERYATPTGVREDDIDVFIRENLAYDTSGFTLNDGSGLSPQNMVTADFLTALLRYAWTETEIKKQLIQRTLASPGDPQRRGSLAYRMNGPLFKNRIFCKTGTLTSIGSSSLCGYVHSHNGHWYAFCIINRNSPVGESRLYQDMLCRELVR